jgi:predicted RNA binding protein YcfA (HicA-like mRNA interferase family)
MREKIVPKNGLLINYLLMSRFEKLLQRLLSMPRDFTWEELIKVLSHFGFVELKKGKTGGSRRKFSDENKNVIILHKPHPGNIVKEYVIKQIITLLKEKGYIKDE